MRFTPHTPEDRRLMLEAIGVKDISELFATIPEDLRLGQELRLPHPLSEPEVRAELEKLAGRNTGTSRLACFAGAGAYDHYVPAVIDTILARSEFYTAYTPYQAEVSQGTLQSIYEFQSLICRLFEMEVCNASMYDCASALGETIHLARDVTKRTRVVVSAGLNPRYLEVMRTYASGLNVPIDVVPLAGLVTDMAALERSVAEPAAAVFIQHPNFFGYLEPVREVARLCHQHNILLVVAVDPISLGLIAPPGAYDADVAVAEGQALGLPLNFGGPYLGIMTAKRKYIRNMPGRIVARTVDIEGRTGYVLALQTREQHIRREKATSNICTNQALCALAATIYLSLLGREGVKEVARHCLAKSHYLANEIGKVSGFQPETGTPFFKEFVVRTPVPAAEVIAAGIAHNILAGVDLGRFNPDWRNRLLVAVTEKRNRAELDGYITFLREEFQN